MFRKIVAIEPVSLNQGSLDALKEKAGEVILYDNAPSSNEEIIRRIADADCVLVSYSTPVDKEVLRACRSLRYIGMCCSLYNPESANVDILEAERLGIAVKGVRDYGDDGVAEYAVAELTRYLHGFGCARWKNSPYPMELGGLRVGIVGLGVTGQVIASALQFFGADIRYFSRTRKPKLEVEKRYAYMPFDKLLENTDALFTCLTRGTVVLYGRELQRFSGDKILFNTSIAPSHDLAALRDWLKDGSNAFFCDTFTALGDDALLKLPNVHCQGQSSGMTLQARARLGAKVHENMDVFLKTGK